MTPEEKKKAKRDYMRAKKKFLEAHPACAVTLYKRSTQIHHSRGRLGALLLDERFWIPVSQTGHNWIHANIAMARKVRWNGIPLICKKGWWNRRPNE